MEQHYKLFRIRKLAENDQDFIKMLAETFLEKNYHEAYQTTHKMKPTIDLFELGVLGTLIKVQDWRKFTKTDFNLQC